MSIEGDREIIKLWNWEWGEIENGGCTYISHGILLDHMRYNIGAHEI